MRFFEVILLLSNLLTFLALVIPRLRATRWPLYSSLFAVLVTGVQILAEGSRWQMVPAYALTGLLLLTSLLLRRLPPTNIAGSAGQRLAIGSVAGLAAIALIFSAALPIIVPFFQFPRPSGSYAIGTLTYHWVDQNRADWGDKNARRELMVQIWYPAEKSAGAQYDTYVQDSMGFSTLLRGMHLPGFFFNHLKNIRTHALQSAPMAENGKRFPMLIFSPGAQGFRQHNTFEVEELVSHGYVVAGIDHPRAASEVVFPDGRRIEFDPRLIDIPRFFKDSKFADGIYNYLGQDVSFALDQIIALNEADPNHILTGRLDTERVGMLGMSLGGLVAAEACRVDRRLRACIMQDVFVPDDVIAAGVQQPAMWLSRDANSMRAEGWPEWEVDVHQSSMRSAFEGVRTDGYIVHVPGMFHVNYTDFPHIICTPIAHKLGLIGSIDWRRGHTIINAYALAFFDHYLKTKPESLLNGPSKQFPEVHLEARHHWRSFDGIEG